MTSRVYDLIRRQAAILSEIDHLDMKELDAVANLAMARAPISSGDTKARRLLRGLVRAQIIGRKGVSIQTDLTERPVTVPASPGFFLVDLMPLPAGGFHAELVLKTPVIAWKIDASNYPQPVIPGPQVFSRWAVLMPNGLVVRDETTDLLCECPLVLKDWIRSEIEWLQDPLSAECDLERPARTAVQ